MAGAALSDITSLPDVLLADRFRLDFGVIPTAAVIQAAGGLNFSDALSIRCQSVMIAGSYIEPVEVGLQGHVVYFRGRKMYPRTLAATYVETKDVPVNALIRGWLEVIVGTNSGNGLSKNQYVRNANLYVYDETGAVALQQTIYNIWPQDINDQQLDGQASQSVLTSVTFQYDYIGMPTLYNIDNSSSLISTIVSAGATVAGG